jgi:prevent-host-death family protein
VGPHPENFHGAVRVQHLIDEAMLDIDPAQAFARTMRDAIFRPMASKISTMQVREKLGEYLDRVALRHDQFVIDRKGKPLAALVPVEKLAELERAVRSHLLESLRLRHRPVSQADADSIADEAKHSTRRRKSG